MVNPNLSLPPTPPIALDYLGDFLNKKEYQVDILDLFLTKNFEKIIASYFDKNKVSVIGITIRNIDDSLFGSQNFYLSTVKEIINHIKKWTNAPLILGGTGFSIMPEIIMEYCGAEFGIQRDGEKSFPLLLKNLKNQENFSKIPNLIYKNGDNYKRNQVEYVDIEKNFLPSRSLVRNESYFKRRGKGNIETKRGCNQNCIYCVDPIGKGREHRLRSPESVGEEIEILFKKGSNAFHVCDSEFNIPEEHAKEVCVEIIRRGLHKKIVWETFANPAPFSEELALLMKKSGCVHVEFGADSGNDQMLESLGKNFTTKDLENTAKICNKHNIKFTYDLLFGGPHETVKSIKETLMVMNKISVENLAISWGIRVYPQTKLSQIILREGPLRGNENIQGNKINNDDFFWPVFYISSMIGKDRISTLLKNVKMGRRDWQIRMLKKIRNYVE